MPKKISVEKYIAKVLARRYWDGAHDRHGVVNMTFEEYSNKSLRNWFSAARGIIACVGRKRFVGRIPDRKEAVVVNCSFYGKGGCTRSLAEAVDRAKEYSSKMKRKAKNEKRKQS